MPLTKDGYRTSWRKLDTYSKSRIVRGSRLCSAKPQIKRILTELGLEMPKKRKAMFRLFLETIGRYKHGISINDQIAELYVDEEFKEIGRRNTVDCMFYLSLEWATLRHEVLNKYGRICMKCRSDKNIAVDHIKPRSIYPELQLEFDNMQVLCRKCNSKKSNRDETDYRAKEAQNNKMDSAE